MKIKKSILSLAVAGTMALGLMPGMTMTALAVDATSYTLIIPSTLTVANKGWNASDGISATGTLESGKKLTVTASSGDEFALVSGENKVSYKLAESGDANTTYADATEKTSWDFAELSGEATSRPLGIVVDDYSSKPAGSYTDTVTFTASVASAAKKLTLGGEYDDDSIDDTVYKELEIEYTDDDTWTDIAKRYDDITIVNNIYGPSGKIIKFWGVCELKSNESTYEYELVSINDKVSAYSSYYLE